MRVLCAQPYEVNEDRYGALHHISKFGRGAFHSRLNFLGSGVLYEDLMFSFDAFLSESEDVGESA